VRRAVLTQLEALPLRPHDAGSGAAGAAALALHSLTGSVDPAVYASVLRPGADSAR